MNSGNTAISLPKIMPLIMWFFRLPLYHLYIFFMCMLILVLCKTKIYSAFISFFMHPASKYHFIYRRIPCSMILCVNFFILFHFFNYILQLLQLLLENFFFVTLLFTAFPVAMLQKQKKTKKTKSLQHDNATK